MESGMEVVGGARCVDLVSLHVVSLLLSFFVSLSWISLHLRLYHPRLYYCRFYSHHDAAKLQTFITRLGIAPDERSRGSDM